MAMYDVKLSYIAQLAPEVKRVPGFELNQIEPFLGLPESLTAKHGNLEIVFES